MLYGVLASGSCILSRMTDSLQEGITALSERTRQPFSLFSFVHSSHEKKYVSINDITYKALKQTIARFPNSTCPHL